MRDDRQLRSGFRLVAGVALAFGVLRGGPVAAQTYPAPWIPTDTICQTVGQTDCWSPLPRVGAAVRDAIAASDDSHNATPQPPQADIFSGENGDQDSVWYGYDSTNQVMMFRMRLSGTPTLAVNGNDDPGTEDAGPFKSNSAWNFVLDLNGDGWGDILVSTDGNTGTHQDPGDTIMLAWANTPGDQQIQIFGSGGKIDLSVDDCNVGGRVLFTRKANEVPAIAGCDTELDPVCDFTYTKVENDCPPSGGVGCDTDSSNFLLFMQFPLAAFDDCTTPDTDGDGFGGAQALFLDSPFSFCVTTSVQPNDFTGKDLALEGVYNMRSDRPFGCSDPCAIDGGCTDKPLILGLSAECGTGTNKSPITLTAEVMSMLVTSNANTLTDTVSNVSIDFMQDGGTSWTRAGVPTGSLTTNPIVDPDTELNLWKMEWDTSSLPTSPTSLYNLRVTVTDDDGNQDVKYYQMDVASSAECGVGTVPVTLATVEAKRDGEWLDVELTTAEEAGNVGFNLYQEVGDALHRLNGHLVVSKAPGPGEPAKYELRVRAAGPGPVWVEDVDLRGRGKMHGPFAVDQVYGRPAPRRPVDWKSVRHALVESAQRVEANAISQRTTREEKFAGAELTVDRDGLYRVTAEDLAAAGFDLSGVKARDLALLRRGQPVQIRVVTKGREAGFGPGSFIEFFGEAERSLATATNVYRLVQDPSLAKRVREDRSRPAGVPSTVAAVATTVERDRRYSVVAANGDPWYDTRIVANGRPAVASFELDASHLAPGGGPATLDLDLWGEALWPQDPDHHVVVRVNGTVVADARFDGVSANPMSIALPAGLLTEGTNSLELELPLDMGTPWDIVYLDSYSLVCDRSLRLENGSLEFSGSAPSFAVSGVPSTGADAYRLERGIVTHLAGGSAIQQENGELRMVFPGSRRPAVYRVVAESAVLVPGIRSMNETTSRQLTSGRADYLIVSHPSLIDGIEPLAQWHRSQGMQVKVVTTDDIYAAYSGGVVDPEAIRSYIADAVGQMGTRWVLLVGGDTYDPLDHLGYGAVSFVPSLYTATGEVVHSAPTDSLFGDVDGDGVPDVALGRLPARSPDELRSMVEKTLQYDARSYRTSAVFTADADESGAALRFTTTSEALIDLLGADWSVTRAYVGALGADRAGDAVVAGINSGASLTTFVGHSGSTMWTFAGLFDVDDVDLLANSGKPTAVVQFGCWNAYFVSPANQSIAGALLRADDRGAAAVLGAATLTELSHEDLLARLLLPDLVTPGRTVGEAVLGAKQELARTRTDLDLRDVLAGWTLLGDPALSLAP